MERGHLKIYSKTKKVIKWLEPFLVDVNLLENNKNKLFDRFSPSEVLVQIIMLVIQNCINPNDKALLSDDPLGYDGLLSKINNSNYRYGIEQTLVFSKEKGDINNNIIDVIIKKELRGKVYGKNRNLVVLINKKRKLNMPLILSQTYRFTNFNSYWLIYKNSENNSSNSFTVFCIKSTIDKVGIIYIVTLNTIDGEGSVEIVQ